MSRLFDSNSTGINILNTICDIIILNFLFIISCLPVFTIGASLSALYYVNLKIVRNEAPAVWKAFWKAFRQNFKQATGIWLVFFFILIILAVDYKLFPTMFAGFSGIMRLIICIFLLFIFCLLIYVFPIIARFVCSGRQAVKNAYLMTFGHFPYTVLLLILHGILPALCLLSSKTLVTITGFFLVCGFALISLLCSYIFNHIFKRYEF